MINKNDLKSVKAAMSCIRFLLVNATRFQTDETTFSTELQQLGLPSEHSAAICRVFKDQSSKLQEHLIKHSLTGSCLDAYNKYLPINPTISTIRFSTSISVNELIDMTHEIPNDAIDCACITFKLKNELVDGVPTQTNHQINIGHSDIKMLLKEMKSVRNLMDEME